MSFKTFIAWRYLRGAQGSENGRGFLRFVSWVAIGGVALGVATLLLALSIVRGFSKEIETKIVGFGAHVQVESIRHTPLTDASSLMTQIREQDAVVSIQPVVTEFVLLRRSSQDIDGVGLWGTDRLPVYLEEHLTNGSANLEQGAAITAPLVIGNTLAESLGLALGDQVTILSTRNLRDTNALLMTRPGLGNSRSRVFMRQRWLILMRLMYLQTLM